MSLSPERTPKKTPPLHSNIPPSPSNMHTTTQTNPARFAFIYIDYLVKNCCFFFFFYLDGLGSLACSYSQLINSEIMNIKDSRQDRLDEWSARRKFTTYTGRHKHRINANIHVCSGIQTHDPWVLHVRNVSCLRPRGHSDRLKIS
jgi:hypothetical protein